MNRKEKNIYLSSCSPVNLRPMMMKDPKNQGKIDEKSIGNYAGDVNLTQKFNLKTRFWRSCAEFGAGDFFHLEFHIFSILTKISLRKSNYRRKFTENSELRSPRGIDNASTLR